MYDRLWVLYSAESAGIQQAAHVVHTENPGQSMQPEHQDRHNRP